MAAEQTERDTEAKSKMVWQSQPFLTLKGLTSYVWCVAWSTIIIWQLSTLKGHSEGVLSVAWSPKGDQLASGSNDKSIIIWDAALSQQLSALKGHTDRVTSVAWSQGDQLASASADRTGPVKTKSRGGRATNSLWPQLTSLGMGACRYGGVRVALRSRMAQMTSSSPYSSSESIM